MGLTLSSLEIAGLLVALPLVAGLHRYSVSYGYRGWTRRVSFKDAFRVVLMIAIIEVILVILHVSPN